MNVSLPVEKVRDLTLLRLPGDLVLVIACDSAGGIGPKERDVVKVPGYVLGRFTARVALMEVLASGALPTVVVSTLSVEPEPVGREIMAGVEEEARESGLDPRRAVTGSSEKNTPTCQTGLGITAIGMAREDELRFGRSVRGDAVMCVGVPKVGGQVRLGDPDIADPRTLKTLLSLGCVHDIIPAGSYGILHEARLLASSAGYGLELEHDISVDIRRSAGPATCLVLSGQAKAREQLAQLVKEPVFLVGWVR